MVDRTTSDTNTAPADRPSLLPHELGLAGLDWFERMLGTWFELGRAHSSQAVLAARDLSNAASTMMGSVVALSLTPPARRDEPAAPAADS